MSYRIYSKVLAQDGSRLYVTFQTSGKAVTLWKAKSKPTDLQHVSFPSFSVTHASSLLIIQKWYIPDYHDISPVIPIDDTKLKITSQPNPGHNPYLITLPVEHHIWVFQEVEANVYRCVRLTSAYCMTNH
jgi:hypothetical protein